MMYEWVAIVEDEEVVWSDFRMQIWLDRLSMHKKDVLGRPVKTSFANSLIEDLNRKKVKFVLEFACGTKVPITFKKRRKRKNGKKNKA